MYYINAWSSYYIIIKYNKNYEKASKTVYNRGSQLVGRSAQSGGPRLRSSIE